MTEIDVDWVAVLTLTIRASAFLLWLRIAVRYWASPPLTIAGRRLVLLVVVLGLACFVAGGLSPFLVPGWLARLLYTGFAAYASIVALAIITTRSK